MFSKVLHGRLKRFLVLGTDYLQIANQPCVNEFGPKFLFVHDVKVNVFKLTMFEE